jgi:hypothetical protein
MGKRSYQIRDVGKPAGDVWNENKSATCVEWSQSPEGREVITRDLATGEIAALPLEVVRQEVQSYNKILQSIR